MTPATSGRVAIVTGAASGIGASVAASLRSSGFRVAGFDLVESDTDLSCIGDVTDIGAVNDAVARATDELGPVDTVVGVAGYYEMIPFSEISEAQWTRMCGCTWGAHQRRAGDVARHARAQSRKHRGGLFGVGDRRG